MLTIAAAGIGWRVLAPTELLDPASTPYPAAVIDGPKVTGTTNAAPLLVDDRIRVFAAKRQVRADGPLDSKLVNTPRWSLRRWPQELSGVVALGPTVISWWSDGALIAIDGRTGKITWRVVGPTGPDYSGNRTGATTVWAPPGLNTTAGAVVLSAGRHLYSYDVSTGSKRWQSDLPTPCVDGFTTAGGQYVCPSGAYELATGTSIVGWPTGPYTPVGCAVAASNCVGLRDRAGQGWLTNAARPVRTPTLDVANSTIAAGLVLSTTRTAIVATPIAGGAPSWTRPTAGQAQVLGATPDNIVVLTANRELWLVDPHTGKLRKAILLRVHSEQSISWTSGLYQVTSRLVAIERLTAHGPTDPADPDYYFTLDTEILAAV